MTETDHDTAVALPAGTPCAKREHEAFAQRVALHGNATAAYKAVYGEGENEKAAGANSCRLAKHPDVARRVLELREERRRYLLQQTADLDALVSNLAVGKAAELFDEDGKPIPVQEWPEHVKAAISGIELEVTSNDDGERVTKYKLKFPDPLAAARLLAQLRGQLVQRSDVTSGGRPLSPMVPVEAVGEDIQSELRRRLIGESVDAEFRELPDDGSDLL